MAEYIDRTELMNDIKPIVYKNGVIVSNLASDIVYQIQDRKTADVIEREKIDQAIAEIAKLPTWGGNLDVSPTTVIEILKRNIGE